MNLKWARHPDFPDAKRPERAHLTDAGMDVFAAEPYVLRYNQVYTIRTGICLELNDYAHVLLVWDKSSLAKRGITTIGGVIDDSYRGEIIILVINLLKSNIQFIHKHDKIAQILVQRVELPTIDAEPSVLSVTGRGDGGFGSTGK